MHENEFSTPVMGTSGATISMSTMADIAKSNDAEPETNIVCGIDLNKYSGCVTEENAQEYHDQIYDLTKIELIQGMKKLVALEKNLYMVRGLVNMADANTSTIKTFANSVDDIVNHLADSETQEETKPVDEPLDDDDFNRDEMLAQLDTYEHQLDAMLDMMHNRYDEIKATGNTSIAEDITETLLKNKSTLENVDNLNAEKYIGYINTVIEELQSHSISRMLPKVSVPKRTRNIITEFCKDIPRSFKEIMNCGFSPAWLSTFADFMWEEQAFSCEADNTMSRNDFAVWSLIFFYHISQIVNAEVKKHNYLSLVYKYYVLQILELENTTKMEEDQRFDENDEEIEASKLRSSVYKEYATVMRAYAEADVNKVMLKNQAKIKDTMLQIMNPPRHRREKPEETPMPLEPRDLQGSTEAAVDNVDEVEVVE